MTDGEGSRFATVVRMLGALLFGVLVLGASSASAAYIHPEATYEFGTDGTSATSFSGGNSLAFNQANQRLYVLEQEGSPRKIYGFHFNSPGSFSGLGGLFPFEVASGGGDPATLGFKPRMTIRQLGGRKGTHRGGNPALQFDLTTRPGDANIKRCRWRFRTRSRSTRGT